VYGNPNSLEIGGWLDPGYRLNIIENKYLLEVNTASYQEPIGANLKIFSVCNHATLAQEISTIGVYRKFLAAQVDILIPIVSPPTADTVDMHMNNTVNEVNNNTNTIHPTIDTNNSNTSSIPLPPTPTDQPLFFIPSTELQHHNLDIHNVTEIQAAFVLSPAFAAERTQLEESDLVSFYSRSICLEYSLEYKSYIMQNYTDNFMNGIATLPRHYPALNDRSIQAALDRVLFTSFIQEFGTHYIHRAVWGAKRVIQVTLKRDVVAQLKRDNFNIGEALAFDFSTNGFVSVNEAVALKTQKDLFDQITGFIVDRREVTIGGSPFIGKHLLPCIVSSHSSSRSLCVNRSCLQYIFVLVVEAEAEADE